MGLAGMVEGTVQWTPKPAAWQTADVTDTPEHESLRDATAWLLGKLHSIHASVARIDRSPGTAWLDTVCVAEKQTQEPGLEQLLQDCHDLASGLDRMMGGLAEKIGPIR